VNRSDLANSLKNKIALTKKDAEKVVITFFDILAETMAKGDRVEIRGFGTFSVKKYKPYKGRNPKTGEKISVPSKTLPFFKVGKELKKNVDR
jgi:integration host factor subunit beta